MSTDFGDIGVFSGAEFRIVVAGLSVGRLCRGRCRASCHIVA